MYSGELTLGIASDIGTRENQQDTSFGQVDGNSAFAVVCDGMGGLQGGELASQTAVELLVNDYYQLEDRSSMKDFFRKEAYKINDAVCDLRDADGSYIEAGTTIVAVSVEDGMLQWFSVGDSKIYIIRGREIAPANREHNYRLALTELLKAGEITREEMEEEEKYAEALISYLGMDDMELMDINENLFQLVDNDVIVLCSDGLYKALDENAIMDIIQTAGSDMQLASKRLIEAVREQGVKNQDNTSVVLLQYHIRRKEED